MDQTTQDIYVDDLQLATSKIAVAVEDRDEAIVQALIAGVPVTVVAGAVGLTRQRVWQIAKATGDPRLA